ncbi:MAG: hypothetical protein ABWW66_02535 [Archaeoglobaceae archaeon]
MGLEEEVVLLIKRALSERIAADGVRFLDVHRANEFAVEMGIDASCVKPVIETINSVLEAKWKSRDSNIL